MTPSPPPLPLDYQTPPPENTRRRFLLQSLIGFGMGVAAFFFGWAFGVSTSSLFLLLLFLTTALTVAIYFDIRQRRFGYAFGVVMAYIMIAAVCFALVLLVLSRPF